MHGCLSPDCLELLGSVLRLVEPRALDLVSRPEERGVEGDIEIFSGGKNVESLLGACEAHDVVGQAKLRRQELGVGIAVLSVVELDRLVVFGAGKLEVGIMIRNENRK